MIIHRLLVLIAMIFICVSRVDAKEMALVGDVSIQEGKSITLWIDSRKLEKDPNQFKDMRFFALAQELRAELGRQVANKNNLKYNDEVIIQHAKMLESQNPSLAQSYKKIRELAGNDETLYARTFFTTKYLDILLQSQAFNPKSDTLNSKIKKSIEELASKLNKKPAEFDSKGKALGYTVKPIVVSLAKGIRTDDGKQEILSVATSLASENAEKAGGILKKGDVSSSLIEGRDHYMILKGKGKDKDGEFHFDAILIPKLSYNDWFWSQAGKIPVTIHDPKLKKEVVERALWGKRLKLSK